MQPVADGACRTALARVPQQSGPESCTHHATPDRPPTAKPAAKLFQLQSQGAAGGANINGLCVILGCAAPLFSGGHSALSAKHHQPAGTQQKHPLSGPAAHPSADCSGSGDTARPDRVFTPTTGFCAGRSAARAARGAVSTQALSVAARSGPGVGKQPAPTFLPPPATLRRSKAIASTRGARPSCRARHQLTLPPT